MKIKTSHKEQRGQTLAMLVVFLGVMIACIMLVVDYGMGVVTRSELQRTVDAAALAGATLLPEDPLGAMATAVNYADRHGVPAEQVTASILPLIPPTDIQVTAEGVGTNFFARYFGTDPADVDATAVARNGLASSIRNIVPIGLDEQFFIINVPLTIESDQNDCKKLPCMLFIDLALGMPGVSEFRENLANGYEDYLSTGTVVQENGNLSKWVTEGCQGRIDRAPGETWDNFEDGSPRLVLVPIMNEADANGQGTFEIVGFGAFFLESVSSSRQITGRFIEYLANGGIAFMGPAWGQLPPPGSPGPGLFGVRVVQLIE